MYLVDTNVLSAGAPTDGVGRPDLTRWMDANSSRLFLSAVTLAEITDGVAEARRTGATRKSERLGEWLEAVLHLYGSRVLPLDVAAARAAGALSDRARAAGHDPGFADLAIAGTADARGLTVLTRNLRHFAPLGVPVLDPYAALPP